MAFQLGALVTAAAAAMMVLCAASPTRASVST